MVLKIFKRTRQNHAIEHGTVAVLLARGVHTPLAGNATPGGFFIYGYLAGEDVRSAADEALRRMQAGERELAVSPYCGTNLVVGALLAGVLSGIILGKTKGRLKRMPAAMGAILVSTLLRRPLGSMVQRRYTTLAHVDDIQITGISTLRIGRFAIHRLNTSRETTWSR